MEKSFLECGNCIWWHLQFLFYNGSNNLFQFLFSKGVVNNYPVMRRSLLQPLLMA
jgi:hypothetical protein